MKKILTFILVFYFLILLQNSLLSYFKVFGTIPNLILISVILATFFEREKVIFEPEQNLSILSAFFGGFFLDIFSNRPIGLSIISLLLLVFILKKILKISETENILWCIFIFVFSIFLFKFFSFLAVGLINFPFSLKGFLSLFPEYFSNSTGAEIVYNLILGILGYYLLELQNIIQGKHRITNTK